MLTTKHLCRKFSITEPTNLPPEALDDLIPDRFYSKAELLGYLRISRARAYTLINNLTEESIRNERFIEEFEMDAMNYSVLEILFYNMRHVQHHAAQLNQLLRQA